MIPSTIQFSIVPTNFAVTRAVWKTPTIVKLHHDTEQYDCLVTLDGDRTKRLLHMDVPTTINDAALLGAKVNTKIKDLQLLEEDLKKIIRGYAKDVRSFLKMEHGKTVSSVCIPYSSKPSAPPEYIGVTNFNSWQVNQDSAKMFEVNFPFVAKEVFKKTEDCFVKDGKRQAMLDSLRKRGMSNADVSAWFEEFFDEKFKYSVVDDFEDRKANQPETVKEFLDQVATQKTPSVTF